ncbi:MAG: beta-carotene 15,15'-monooxygenase [Bacteroidota bacterium]
MDRRIPIFKSWVPGWAIKIILFSLILPTLVLFFLPFANINAAAGYYGSEPADIQFTVALFYAGYIAFYSLERRFFNYLAAKEYFVIFTMLELLTTLICYLTNDLYLLFPIRFFQGMLFSSTVNLSLSLMFTRLHSERAREISFSVFFGMLICVLPFTNLVTADLIDSYNFNLVYKGALFSYLPCLCLIMLCMNNIRLNVRFHLYKLDWQSFLFWSIMLVLLGYITIYGQEYYWLEDSRIFYSAVAIVVSTLVYIMRQRVLKRPYLNLEIFRFRNFKFAIFLIFILYVCRFAANITNSFFAGVIKLDPIHISYVNTINLLGLILGIIISCVMILQKMNIRFIWFPGFILLLAFHVMMYFLFATEANENNFYAPLFMQGLGVGMILVPTIVYAISAVPVASGPSATSICSTMGYVGFCISAALINFCELYEKSRHYNAFQDHLTKIDQFAVHALSLRSSNLLSKGLSLKQSAKGASKQLVSAVNQQIQIRFAMDYYELMSIMLIITLLLIALFPYLNRTAAYLRSRRLAPA